MKKFFRKGNAFLGFVNIGRDKDAQFGIHPVWGRIVLLLCGLAVAGWVAVAFAGFLFLKHTRDIETGRFADLLFFRWDEYRVAWGEDYIERGRELIEEGEGREGFHFLRVGLVRSPENIEGRLLLANILLAQNRPDHSARLLVEGMPYGYGDTDYVTTTMRLLLRTEKDDEIRAIADEFLPEEPDSEERHIIIAFAAARASFHRGDFDRAVRFIEDYRLDQSNSGRILLARIDWERGSRAEAIDRLERMARSRPENNDALLYLTRFHHDSGDIASAERYAVMRQLHDPLNALPRIDLLYIYHEKGDDERLREEIDSILNEFRSDREAIEYLAQFALDTTDVGLARRIFEHVQLRGQNLGIPGIVLIHTHMKAGEYDRATALADRLSSEVDGFSEQFGAQLIAVNAIADYAQGDRAEGDLKISQFLGRQDLRPANYITYSNKLLELGLHDPARRILAQAHHTNPRSQSLLSALIRLDIERGDGTALISNLPKLMDMRLPPPDVLNEAYLFLSSDRFLYALERQEILEELEAALQRHPVITLG